MEYFLKLTFSNST